MGTTNNLGQGFSVVAKRIAADIARQTDGFSKPQIKKVIKEVKKAVGYLQ